MITVDLTGRAALVTGGTSGIGRATVERFARAGARVVFAGRDARRGAAIVAALRADGCEVDFVQADLVDAEAASSLGEMALGLVGGRLDILVNNAGMSGLGPTVDMDEPTFDQLFATNVKAPFFLVAAVAPVMAEHKSGTIINVTSASARMGVAGMAVYGATKAALELLTKSWTSEFGASGIRVNSVCPGIVDSPPVAALDQQTRTNLASQIPAGQLARPDEVAAVIEFLASDSASHVYGTSLGVDGGRTAV